jgi:tetratricopeptide (TPR) repeat protein
MAVALLSLVLCVSGGFSKLNNLRVQQAMDRGDDAAADAYLALSKRIPDGSSETVFLAARIARHVGDFHEMSTLLETAERGRYNIGRIKRERALVLAQIGQLSDSLESSLNAWILEGGTDSREICSAYANGLAASSRFEEAIRVLDAWSLDFPDDPRPVFRHGRILEHQRRNEEALAKYELSRAVSPHFAPAAFSIGRLLLEKRQIDDALVAFQKCPRASTSIPVRTSIAICYKSQAKIEDARQILEQVIQTPVKEIMRAYSEVEESPERFVAAAELAKIESDEGHFERAKELLEMAIAFNARDLEARYSYAVTLRGLRRNEEAEQEFNYVKQTREALANVNVFWDRVDANPRDTEARLALAKIFLNHESKRNGLYWLKSISLYEPDNVEVAELLRANAEEPDVGPPRK